MKVTPRVKKINKAIRLYKNECNRHFVNRSDEIDAIFSAILTKQHILLKGRPGLAKSQLASVVFSGISGAQLFKKQLRRMMSEEAVFGVLNIKKWREEATYEYNVANTAATAHLAIFEEIYDASDALLRSLLELFNERIFTSGHQMVQCPLHTAVATSNFYRSTEEAEALSDRLLIKIEVPAMDDDDELVELLMKKTGKEKVFPGLKSTLDFNDLKFMSMRRARVEVPEDIHKLFVELTKKYIANLKQPDFYISPRRMIQIVKLIQAESMTHGRMLAEYTDVSAAKFGLVFLGNDQQEDAFNVAFKNVVETKKKFLEAQKSLNESIEGAEVMEEALEEAIKEKNTTKLKELKMYASTILEGLDVQAKFGFPEIDGKFDEIKVKIKEMQGKLKSV